MAGESIDALEKTIERADDKSSCSEESDYLRNAEPSTRQSSGSRGEALGDNRRTNKSNNRQYYKCINPGVSSIESDKGYNE